MLAPLMVEEFVLFNTPLMNSEQFMVVNLESVALKVKFKEVRFVNELLGGEISTTGML